MPGRHKDSGGSEPKLTRQQAALAGRVLKTLWTAEQGTPSDEDRMRFHREINAAFAQAGYAPNYSERKLGDAISNRMYTWRLAQRNKVPQSWAAGARANRKNRKRTQDEITQNNTNKAADLQNGQLAEENKAAEIPNPSSQLAEEKGQGMVTPRGTSSLIEGCGCDMETFGIPLPLGENDFTCTVEAPALPTDLDLQITTVSTTIDDSWNVLATLDNTDLLPSPPSSPMESPTPQDASMCGTDMTYDVASDCTCGATLPLDDLDLLLEQAQVDIDMPQGIEMCNVELPSVDIPQHFGLGAKEKVDDKRSSVAGDRSVSMSTTGREIKSENPGWLTLKAGVTPSRTQSSEPQRKVRKIDPHQPWRDPPSKEGKGGQTLVDAQMAAFERFETPSLAAPFDATPLQPRLEPPRRVLQTLNPQRQPATAA